MPDKCYTFKNVQFPFGALAFNSDGTELVGGTKNDTVNVYSCVSGDHLQKGSFIYEGGDILAMDFSEDGSQLISIDHRNTVTTRKKVSGVHD